MNRELFRKTLSYLSRREHSRFELSRKLRRWGDPDDIEKVLDKAEQLGYLSDTRFAVQRAQYQRRRRRWGNQRLRSDLRARGVNARIVNQVLARVDSELPEEESLTQLISAWEQKHGAPTNRARLKALFDHCRRKGYPASAIRIRLEPYFERLE